MLELGDARAIDADRVQRVLQELLRVVAGTQLAEPIPERHDEVDDLLDIGAATMLARDRQQQQLRRAEDDLRLLRRRLAADAFEEPAQRADRVRLVEDLDDR